MKLPQVFIPWLRRVPLGLETVLVLLLFWQLAGLFWFAVSPKVQHGNLVMPQAVPDSHAVSTQNLQNWFSHTQPETMAPAGDLQLIAVISGARGVALLGGVQASAVAVRVGEEIRPGSRLIGVTASAVEIEQGGKRQYLAFLNKSASSPAALIVAAPPAARSAVKSRSLTRGQLSGVLRGGNLADWSSGLSSYRDGGIQIENVSKQPLMQALQLLNGDVLKRISGRAIRELADISLVYNQLSQQAAVEVTVLRDGALQTLHYKINP